MPLLLLSSVQEETVEAFKSYIISIKKGRLDVNIHNVGLYKWLKNGKYASYDSYQSHVRVMSKELNVDLLVDSSFSFFVIIHTNSACHFESKLSVNHEFNNKPAQQG